MSGVSFGDLAQSYLLKSRIGSLKSQTLRLSDELASGRKADVAASVAGDLTTLSALEHSRALSQGFLAASRDAAHKLDARQSVLGVVSQHLTSAMQALGLASQDSGFSQVKRIADDARSLFSEAIQQLNTQIAGRPLFAGMATNGKAIADGKLIIGELNSLTSSARTADEIAGIVSDWFDDPAGFESFAYQGQATEPPAVLSPEGQTVAGTTALDPKIKAALAGLALASLIDHPALTPTGADRMSLRERALSMLYSGQDDVTDLASRIGADQSRIAGLQSRYQAEDLSFQIAISEIVTADPAQTAMELEAVRTNLETVYSVTARISRLTLADFLR
ncbi:flagellin [Thioclava sp. FR2]|uniref:flagellin n=1 Tax=Thioclava sp. FR2 TaxID=3445780 RepID=UPI003EBA455F